MKNSVLLISFLFLSSVVLIAQKDSSGLLKVNDEYLKIDAKANDPLYTTYAASMDRSRLYGDKAYKMDYYSESEPLHYWSDQAGRFFTVWMVDKLVIDKISKFHKKPVVIASFPDMAIMEYQPFEGLKVQETFMVYSSTIAVVNMYITNLTKDTHTLDIYPVLELGNDSLLIKGFDSETHSYITEHFETKKRLISNLYTNAPYPTDVRDVFTVNFSPYSFGGYSGNLDDFYLTIKTDWYAENRIDSLNKRTDGYVDFLSIHGRFDLTPGESINLRYYRGLQANHEDVQELIAGIEDLKNKNLQQFVDQNETLYASIPRIHFKTEDEKMVYLGALNLVRSCMLPPSEKTSHNFYVFSRNPLWGWGHGHQVLHESLSMMAYVYLDAKSSQGSQRVYMEQQGKDGLIAYRHGPRGAQTYPHKGKPTTSAPFYNWINWEIYNVSGDKEFLEDAYLSGTKYMNWLIKNRDTDRDGTFEWGPYGIIENVRDWYNVVFQVSKERFLDIDKEDISDELECLDLSLMVVKEMRCLSQMAVELSRKKESKRWENKADRIASLINKLMWDEESGFYYHVDKKDHSFTFLDRDLKHQEIIGFLALWAGVAPPDRAERLIETLTDPDKFWRKYGVPTLSAKDSWYSPYVDYCCKWNGPVWLLWDYMVFEGLLNYGYFDLARELANKMLLAVTTQLSMNHNFWESFSPDNTVLDCPSNYIWDSIMAKLLIELYEMDKDIVSQID